MSREHMLVPSQTPSVVLLNDKSVSSNFLYLWSRLRCSIEALLLHILSRLNVPIPRAQVSMKVSIAPCGLNRTKKLYD
jgi:hypothetical protein